MKVSKKILAHNMKLLRKRGTYTQDRLARELQIGRPRIGAWEEQRAWPEIPMLFKLSDFFKVDAKKLVTEKFN